MDNPIYYGGGGGGGGGPEEALLGPRGAAAAGGGAQYLGPMETIQIHGEMHELCCVLDRGCELVSAVVTANLIMRVLGPTLLSLNCSSLCA